MKLTLEEIWKMVDVLEEAQKVTLKGKVALEEEKRKAETKERVLKLPKLQISENWGKEETVERAELKRIVDSATRGATDPFSRLRAIQNQMQEIASGAAVKNPRRILSQIMLLETLNRMFKSFQPSPAGFINEALLSVFYGSTQKGATEANLEGDIGDITDKGIPVSLKTLVGGQSANVKGSVRNLINSINSAGKVYFDLYLKDSSGAKSEVGSLTFYRFTIDATNINEFLQYEPGTIATGTDGKLVVPASLMKEAVVNLAEQPEDEEPVDIIAGDDLPQNLRNEFAVLAGKKGNIDSSVKKANIAFNILQKNNFILPRAGNFTEFVNNLDSTAIASLVDQINKVPQTSNSVKLVNYLSGEDIGKPSKSTKQVETEFVIPPGHWKKFVNAEKTEGKQIVLEFSDQRIQQIIEVAVKSIDENITEMFNNLSDFTTSLQSYLTSTTRGRGQQGEKAVELAKKLPTQTTKIVKDYGR
jgi:hypothetical protein